MKPPFKAIIFDFGDVLCFWDDTVLRPEYARAHGLPDDSIRELIFEYQRQGGEGKFHSLTDYYSRSQLETPVPVAVANQAFAEWERSARIEPRSIELITALRGTYKIGLLSNFTKGLEVYLIDRFNIHQLFDAVVSSYDIQMRKPKMDVYHYIARQLNVQPAECLFIDDREKNVFGAQEAGMSGILFTGIDALQKTLTEVLPVPATSSTVA